MMKINFVKRFAELFVVLVITGTFILTAAAQTKSVKKVDALASRTCSLRSISGNYGLSVTGVNLLPPSTTIQIAAVGLATFDGEGTMTGSVTTSFGGTVTADTVTAAYTVEPNCTGTFTVTFNNGFTIHNNLVIVNEGKEILFIQTDPGTINAGSLKRQ
ncbi:MAG TPA: hypothetical protein VGC97_21055 [Pyrinomonadaceae bacterium]|jgi:hypothetical protein